MLAAIFGLLTMQAQAGEGEVALFDDFTGAFAAWVEAKEKEDICGFGWFGAGEVTDIIERATATFFIDGEAGDGTLEKYLATLATRDSHPGRAAIYFAQGDTLGHYLETLARVARNAGHAAAVEGPCQVRELARNAEEAEDVIIEMLNVAEE